MTGHFDRCPLCGYYESRHAENKCPEEGDNVMPDQRGQQERFAKLTQGKGAQQRLDMLLAVAQSHNVLSAINDTLEKYAAIDEEPDDCTCGARLFPDAHKPGCPQREEITYAEAAIRPQGVSWYVPPPNTRSLNAMESLVVVNQWKQAQAAALRYELTKPLDQGTLQHMLSVMLTMLMGDPQS